MSVLWPVRLSKRENAERSSQGELTLASVKMIEMQRRQLNNKMMGRSSRNCITGEILLRTENTQFPDFFLVDLRQREGLPPSLADLKEDPYLFKPVALPYRTWLYHEAVRHFAAIQSSDSDALVRHVLSRFCIDVPINGGRCSPLCRFAPLFLATGLTGDLVLMLVTVCVTVLVFAISHTSNHESYYRCERLFSLFVRWPFLGFLCTRFHSSDALALCGFLSTLVACIADIWFGDLAVVVSYRWHCSYEVVNVLPSRLYACRRHGGAGMDLEPNKGVVADFVCGFSPWEKTHALIAEVGGLLLELRPMTERDWAQAFAEYDRRKSPLPYVGLDALNPKGENSTAFRDDCTPNRSGAKTDLLAQTSRSTSGARSAAPKPPPGFDWKTTLSNLEVEDF